MYNASPRRERSLSRRLASAFVAQWLALRPDDAIVQRDVGIDHPPLLTEAWIAACFTPEDERTPDQHAVLAYSDAAIDELTRADLVLIATPRYNYGMPAAVKAWFAQYQEFGDERHRASLQAATDTANALASRLASHAVAQRCQERYHA